MTSIGKTKLPLKSKIGFLLHVHVYTYLFKSDKTNLDYSDTHIYIRTQSFISGCMPLKKHGHDFGSSLNVYNALVRHI